MASPSLRHHVMTKYDKELDTRTDEYDEAMKPKRDEQDVQRELRDAQKDEQAKQDE